MSSAKSRSPTDSVNVHVIPLLTPMSVLFIIQSIARRNRNGDNIHPCFTPVLISNSSVKCWPHITFVLNPSCNIFMMVTILQGIPYCRNIHQRDSLWMLSKAFSKSMKFT